MTRWRRAFGVAMGVVLIVLGLLDVHVQLGAILAGLVLVGVLSGDLLAEALRRR